MITKSNETRSVVVKGITTDRFQFSLYAISNAVNTAISSISLEKVQCKAILTRGGRNYTLFNDNLFVLNNDSSFYGGAFYPPSAALSSYNIMTQAAGAKHAVGMGGYITLPGFINLRGNDELYIECTVDSSTFGTNSDTSLSYVDFDVVQTVGVEYAIPVIRTYSIGPGDSAFNQNIGDNVVRVSLMNLDKTTSDIATATNQVINNAGISSNLARTRDSFNSLFAKRLSMFDTAANALTRCQSYVIYDGEEVDGAVCDINLNSGGVNAGKNVVVVRQFEDDAATFAVGVISSAQHADERAQKAGVPTTISAEMKKTKRAIIEGRR